MVPGVAGHPFDRGHALEVMTRFVFHRHGNAAGQLRRLLAAETTHARAGVIFGRHHGGEHHHEANLLAGGDHVHLAMPHAAAPPDAHCFRIYQSSAFLTDPSACRTA
jgi:hypothetical protein